jgi:hypothetical protein
MKEIMFEIGTASSAAVESLGEMRVKQFGAEIPTPLIQENG